MNSSKVQNAALATDQQTSDLIGRHELARRLDVDVRTVSRMVDRGELPRPCIGQGGRPRWQWQYVSEFLRKRHEQNARLDARVKEKLRKG